MSAGPLFDATTNAPAGVKGALEDVLANSLVNDSFVDVAFYAYSKRDRTGKVYGMKRVLANGTILQASSPYLRGLLSGGVAEGNDTEKTLANAHTDCFDYEADSDLEDDDEPKEKENSKPPPTPSTARSESTISMSTIDSDLKLSVDEDWALSSYQRRYKIVPMRSVAASTLKSLVYYIYTGRVYFLPLTSSGTKEKERAMAEHLRKHPGRPVCSSKSMYRLADEMGFGDLKEEARKHIFTNLNSDNILDEIFSVFSSKYQEILEKQVIAFESHSSSGGLDAVLARKIDGVAKGQMPYASAAVLALICQKRSLSPVQPRPLLPLFLPATETKQGVAPTPAVAPAVVPVAKLPEWMAAPSVPERSLPVSSTKQASVSKCKEWSESKSEKEPGSSSSKVSSGWVSKGMVRIGSSTKDG